MIEQLIEKYKEKSLENGMIDIFSVIQDLKALKGEEEEIKCGCVVTSRMWKATLCLSCGWRIKDKAKLVLLSLPNHLQRVDYGLSRSH